MDIFNDPFYKAIRARIEYAERALQKALEDDNYLVAGVEKAQLDVLTEVNNLYVHLRNEVSSAE